MAETAVTTVGAVTAPSSGNGHTAGLREPRLFREACYVDGRWVATGARGVIKVDNPATGEILGTVPRLDAAETRLAIEAAERAFPAWRKKTGKERAVVMRR